jgi:hypothetical protein
LYRAHVRPVSHIDCVIKWDPEKLIITPWAPAHFPWFLLSYHTCRRYFTTQICLPCPCDVLLWKYLIPFSIYGARCRLCCRSRTLVKVANCWSSTLVGPLPRSQTSVTPCI